MIKSEIKSKAFHQARLHSERVRVLALLSAFGSMLLLVLIRGGVAIVQGHGGEAWPFLLLLAAAAAYEMLWLRRVRRAIQFSQEVPFANWATTFFIESLLPTITLVLQIHVSFIGPHRALTSPAVLAYFLFIILSTLHLTPALSRLAGAFSAGGYLAVSIYVFLHFPENGNEPLAYVISFSYAALLLIGGFTAGAVAKQIQLYVVAALREAESKARIAQMEHDLGVARSIQQGLLPEKAPQITGFDIAGWNQPADETGGDYFDWQQLEDGRIAVTIADVTGHGIASALCMAACRAYARAGFVVEPDLRNFLRRMNRLLYADLPGSKFVTLAAGVLHPAEATLQLISAGHGPLLFYSSAENSFRRYEAHGLPLGMMPRDSYGTAEALTFGRGDILVLVTDGFLEWANAHDEDFGEERLKELVRAHRDKPAATIISELYSSVVTFAGGTPQLDDLTALVVKRI